MADCNISYTLGTTRDASGGYISCKLKLRTYALFKNTSQTKDDIKSLSQSKTILSGTIVWKRVFLWIHNILC